MPDGGVGSCSSITPWCMDGFCMSLPEAPKHRRGAAIGANGRLWLAPVSSNTLATISPASSLEKVVLPSVNQPGQMVGAVSAMTAVSPTDIYACSPFSIVWHYDGAQWSQLPAGWLNGECDVLWAASANDFWSIGLNTLRRKLNGTWTSPAASLPVYAVDGRGPDNVWIGGSHGYLAHWDGTQYQVLIDVSQDSDVPDVRAVALLGPSDIAFGTNRLINGNVMTSAQLGYPAAPEITWGSSDDFWIVTKFNGLTPRALWHFSGGAWTQQTVPAAFDLSATEIIGSATNAVWFLSDHAILHWDGSVLASCATWQPPQPTGRLRGIGASYQELWLHEASTNQLFRSEAGAAFVNVHLGGVEGFDAHSSGVFAVAGTDAPSPGPSGTLPIVERYAGGTSWTSITCPWTPGDFSWLRAAKVIGGNDVWFAGDGGHVYHWDGSACTAVSHPLASTPFRRIEGTGPSDVWFFGDSATLHWNGTSLLRNAQTIPAIDAVAAGTHLLALADPDVREWDGTTWTTISPAGGFVSPRQIWSTSTSDIWVDGVTLNHFDGSSWTTVAVPPQVYAGFGNGGGIWGNGVPGDFVISHRSGILHHQ